MKRVFQTIIDKGKGNCMQAALASLFDLELDKVPNFKEYGDNWFQEFFSFIRKQGYVFDGTLYNNNVQRLENPEFYEENFIKLGRELPKNRFAELKSMDGVNGYFFASVYSPAYYNREDKTPIKHAVVIDSDLNIIHDPNPNNINVLEYPMAKDIKYNGIVDIFMINLQKDE